MAVPRSELVAAPIAVTGLGLVTSAGTGARAGWEGVCAGRSTARPDSELAGLPVPFSCRVPGFEAGPADGSRSWRLDRATRLALTAAREAVADAGLSAEDWPTERVAVVLGSAAGGIGTLEAQHQRLLERGPRSLSPLTLPAFLPNMAAGQLAIDLHVGGPVLHTSTACASGATAIGIAAGLLAAGACDIALAGGADAMVTRLCSAAFARMGALSTRVHDPAAASRPFDADRDGFVLAEGAALLVLERAADARARRRRPHALLAGFAATCDAHHATAPDPQGRAVERALHQALARADACPGDVDHVNAHGTSTRLNDAAEAAVLARVLPDRPTVTSAKGVLGHTMGAAGAIEAALTVLTVEHQLAPPTANFHHADPDADRLDIVAGTVRRQRVGLALSNSFGFGGHNTVLAFTPP